MSRQEVLALEVEGKVSANHSQILTAFPLAPAEPWLTHEATLHSPSKSGSRHDSGACGHDPSKCCFLDSALGNARKCKATSSNKKNGNCRQFLFCFSPGTFRD